MRKISEKCKMFLYDDCFGYTIMIVDDVGECQVNTFIHQNEYTRVNWR